MGLARALGLVRLLDRAPAQARHGHRSAARPGGKWVTVTNWVTGTSWLRPASALAAIAFLAIVTVAVPPLRQAIGHVTAKVLTRGQSSGGGGTEGNGSPTGNAGGSSKTGAGGQAGASTSATGTASRRSSAASTCHPATAAATVAAQASRTSIAAAVSSALPATTAGCTATPATPTQPASGNVRGAQYVAGSDADHGRDRQPVGVAYRYTDQPVSECHQHGWAYTAPPTPVRHRRHHDPGGGHAD